MFKIYYKIPDSDNDKQNQLMGMLYENTRLNILLALQPYGKILDKEDGMLVIERKEDDNIEFRYEGLSEAAELIVRTVISNMAKRNRMRW